MDEILEPVTWLKHKYTTTKWRSPYQGGEHAAPRRKRKKTPNKDKPTTQHVLVLNANGKFHWIWRPVG